ncbi:MULTISPECIES: TetR/AcrR family transcriptional regulator [unclassified Mesorhizobium]|uniref:TetR/AcrR family transcriptional regulator n=1 Tax=unclassified Mesorhizobium TaxID=325217 RepID=UPI00112E25B8|nr:MULTISPECIES: TetR/AcrR family transcriptional regulator [unclassified Mesorhizobium]MBZ9810558.1 TetR/AcrR family transcriptional regulator [Mesorhizobium sp. ESP-6-2]TPM34060.1 TetR/AcrR family transcriptional regulator [Mesorhizobium sp. B2-2-2]
MTQNKTKVAPTATRGEPLRQRVIDAAERLLRQGKADFSMRDLATEAGVSFATPFNQFGSKAAIMHALSRRRIDTMAQRFAGMSPPADAAGRVLLAIDTAVEVMLEEPEINRAVMGWIGTAGPSPGRVLAHSTTLWSLALGAGEGLIAAGRQEALRSLPEQLAFAFRGVLSFWTAGELPDEALASKAREIAKTLLLGFAERPLIGDSVS